MAEFELNPEILQTATGSITGDISQIQTAIYGREVRASIAECLYLLLQRFENFESELTAIQTKIESQIFDVTSKIENYSRTLDETVQKSENLQSSVNLLENRTEIYQQAIEDHCNALNRFARYPDLDGDGRVSATDVSMILNASVQDNSGGDSGLTDEQRRLADINGDGTCNAEDAALMSEFSASLGAGLYENNAFGWLKFKQDKGIL